MTNERAQVWRVRALWPGGGETSYFDDFDSADTYAYYENIENGKDCDGPTLGYWTPAERRCPKIVCLCGSGRFREAFERAEFDETLAGAIVLTIGCNTKDIARSSDLAHHKPMLDELHMRKIELADEVLILNVAGYIGESTRREMEYARKLRKVVRFLESPAESEVTNGQA